MYISTAGLTGVCVNFIGRDIAGDGLIWASLIGDTLAIVLIEERRGGGGI